MVTLLYTISVLWIRLRTDYGY